MELNQITFYNEIKKYMINPNKWIRLRQSNDCVELTVKHVFLKNEATIQKVKEYGIMVSDLHGANSLLESMGIVKRNYQEKIRHSFQYQIDGVIAEVEIDEWLFLDSYMEIECDDEVVMNYYYETRVFIETNCIFQYKTII